MSTTKTKPKTEEPAASATQAVAKIDRSLGSVPAHLRGDMEEYAGAGVSNRREDSLVPYLYIAQKGSPQVNKRDAAYIEGLEPGYVFDTSTRQFWNAEVEGNGPLMVQFYFEACEVEWGLRNTPEKGYKGRHPYDTPLLNEIVERPKESGRGVNRIIRNGHQLVTTKYHYMILADDLRPVALALSSSGLQASRDFNTTLSNRKIRTPRGLLPAPSFATLTRLRTFWVQDGDFDWFVPRLEDLGWITEEYGDAYDLAKTMFASAVKSGVRTEEPMEADPSAVADGPHGPDPDANPEDRSPI